MSNGRHRYKGIIIGAVLGMLPVALALIPFTITWWYAKGNLFEINAVQNLIWVVYFLVLLLYMGVMAGINILSGYIVNKLGADNNE